MPNLSVTVAEAGRALGLQVPPGKSIAYGLKDGYLVELARGRDEGQECVTTIVRYDDATRDAAVRDAVSHSPTLSARKINLKHVKISDGVLVYSHHRNLFRSVRSDLVAGQLEALLGAVKQAAPAPAAVCRLCGGASGSAPILLNDVVDRVCPACIERLQHEVKQAMARYEDLPLNLPLTVLVAAVLALITAGAWAGVTLVTGRMFWLVALGGGMLIGWGTLRAAGRGGAVVQIIGGLFTVLGVLLGQSLVLAYQVNEVVKARGGQIRWSAFAEALPRLLWSSGTDTLFALGGGLIGAYYAARRAAKPTLEVKVEKSPS